MTSETSEVRMVPASTNRAARKLHVPECALCEDGRVPAERRFGGDGLADCDHCDGSGDARVARYVGVELADEAARGSRRWPLRWTRWRETDDGESTEATALDVGEFVVEWDGETALSFDPPVADDVAEQARRYVRGSLIPSDHPFNTWEAKRRADALLERARADYRADLPALAVEVRSDGRGVRSLPFYARVGAETAVRNGAQARARMADWLRTVDGYMHARSVVCDPDGVPRRGDLYVELDVERCSSRHLTADEAREFAARGTWPEILAAITFPETT